MNDDHKIRYLDSLTEAFMIEYENYAKSQTFKSSVKKSNAFIVAMDNIMDLVEAVDGWGEFYHMLLAKEFNLFEKLVDVGLWKVNK